MPAVSSSTHGHSGGATSSTNTTLSLSRSRSLKTLTHDPTLGSTCAAFGLSGRHRHSIAFPCAKVDKKKTNKLLCASVAKGDIAQIESLVLQDGGDIEFTDTLGRSLHNIAEQSERLLPAEKEQVRNLLNDLPGRLGVCQDDAIFTGLKQNANATKHKFFQRNRELVRSFSEQIIKGTPATAEPRFGPEELSKLILSRNADLLKTPQDQVEKTLAHWVKALGSETAINGLSKSGALLYSNPESIKDNAPSWAQLLGHVEVAMYYFSRCPKLLDLSHSARTRLWNQVLEIVKDKQLVFWVMHQSMVPAKLEVTGRSTYGSPFQGTYSRIDGCNVNNRVVYVKDEIVPPPPKLGSGPAPEFESPRSRHERVAAEQLIQQQQQQYQNQDSGSNNQTQQSAVSAKIAAAGERVKPKKETLDDLPTVKIPRNVQYIFLDEKQNWCIAPQKDPISKIPLKRVVPIVRRRLNKKDPQAVLEPCQKYIDKFLWETLQPGSSSAESESNAIFQEDVRVQVNAIEDKNFKPNSLFFIDPREVRASYAAIKEMIGPVWAVNSSTIETKYDICPDTREGDPIYTKTLSGPVLNFKSFGEFGSLRQYIYVRADKRRDSGHVEIDKVACQLACWTPVLVSLLFWTPEADLPKAASADASADSEPSSSSDKLLNSVPWLKDDLWREKPNSECPRCIKAPFTKGKFRVFVKSFPKGSVVIKGTGIAQTDSTPSPDTVVPPRPPLIFVKSGAYAYSSTLTMTTTESADPISNEIVSQSKASPILINQATDAGDPLFSISDPEYDAKKSQELDLEKQRISMEEKNEKDQKKADKEAKAAKTGKPPTPESSAGGRSVDDPHWKTSHRHPGDWEMLVLGSFSPMDGYCYLQQWWEDMNNRLMKTDRPMMVIEVSVPSTVFLVYFEKANNLPDPVKTWHTLDRWSTSDRLKCPIIRERKSMTERKGYIVKFKEFPAGEIKIKSSQGVLCLAFFKATPPRSSDVNATDPDRAKVAVIERPRLLNTSETVIKLFKRMRQEFGDVSARRYLCRQEVAPGYLITSTWQRRMYEVEEWVRDLKLEMLENLGVLTQQDCENALNLYPEILKVDGPTLTAAFNTLVKLNVFGSKKALQEALLKCPLLLCVVAEDIKIAHQKIHYVFEEQSTLLFASRPDLLQVGPQIQRLFDKLYELFVPTTSERFVNLRLKESVMEQSGWQLWYVMLRKGEKEVDKWIGELQSYEDSKSLEKQIGGCQPYKTSTEIQKVDWGIEGE